MSKYPDDLDDDYVGPWEDPPSQYPDRTRPDRTVSVKTLVRIGAAVVIVLAVAWFGWQKYETHQETERTNAVTEQVMESMQQKFDTDTDLTPYSVRVVKVNLIKESEHKYIGQATVQTPRTSWHQVSIEVTADDSNVMWQAEPGALLFLAQEALSSSAGG